MSDVRQRAKDFLNNLALEVPIISLKKGTKEETEPKFRKYTGVEHKTLMDFWRKYKPPASKRVLTTCNELVNYYCDAVGFRTKLGGFNSKVIVQNNSLQNAWVASEDGKHPEFGDIIWYAADGDISGHVDIAMEYAGNLWRMASGQGGPKRDPATQDPIEGLSYDRIDKVTSRGKDGSPATYDYKRVKGWIDIELAWPQLQPPPQWLLGWWRHVFDDSGEAYYYWYGYDRKMWWTEMKPWGRMTRVFPPDGAGGGYTNTSETEVAIKWGSGTTETYSRDGDDHMTGTYRGDTLTATRVK